eukprot:m.230901 g.230901  ORF g.230901 m.230901 type:complete len:122 (+) comp19263_c0_seq6:955-1320(+)
MAGIFSMEDFFSDVNRIRRKINAMEHIVENMHQHCEEILVAYCCERKQFASKSLQKQQSEILQLAEEVDDMLREMGQQNTVSIGEARQEMPVCVRIHQTQHWTLCTKFMEVRNGIVTCSIN